MTEGRSRWPFGDSDMAQRIRMRDWAATPLGPVETWPQRLKTAVELMLDLPQMACIAWGLPNLTLLYNDAYAALLGAKHPAALGQPFAEVRSEPEVQRMVAATLGGEIQRFVDRPYEFPSRTERPAGWFTGGWTPLREESGRIVGFYAAGIETTDRVLAERSLHASEERQAFLLKLSDALRPLTDPAAIEGEACRHLAERLDVDRVYYVEIDEIAGIARVERDFVRGDAASIAGEHRVADFAWSVAILRHGECHVISDTRASELIPPADRPACSALCIIACMGAPLIKKGRLVGALCATSSHRRAWTENEVTLLREVGERIWAAVEHARAEAALRESEGRYRTLIAAMDEGVMIFERLPLRPDGLRDWRYVAMNPASQSMFGTGDLTGQSVRDNFPDEDEGWYDIYDRALEAGEVARFDREARSKRAILQMYVARVGDAARERIMVVMRDVTERRRAEAALRESGERYRILFQSIDEGFCTIEVLFDLQGRACDYRFLQVNPAFERHTGLAGAVGRTVREMVPEHEEHWFEIYGRIALTGEPARFENRAEALGRWYDVYAFRVGDPGQRHVAVLFRDVLQRKQAEAALRESEARFRALVTAGSHLTYRMSPDWRQMRQLSGRGVLADTPEPIEDWTDKYIPHEDRPIVSAAIGQAMRDKSLFELEHRVRRADGSVGWVLSRAVPILGPQDEVVEWFGAGTDVTERRVAQERLHASEELFRGFAENSADVLWITDSTGTRLQYLSPAFEPMFGERRDRIMSDLRRWAELVHPDDREHAASFMPRAIAGEVAIAHYRVVRPADGRIVHLRDTGFPIRDAASGTIRHVAGIVQDVSDLIQSGEALEAEKERFRTLAEGIPHLVWRSGENGVWNWSSPQWRDYTGQSQAQSQGLGWLDAVHPDDREATMRAWAGAQSLGRLDVEYRVRRASDGIWRYFSTRSVPLRGPPEPGYPDGRILEWLGTSTDIEDLKRLQGQQTVLVAELQHRTRNLLAVVRNVARRSIKPSPGRDEYDARLAALGRVQGFLSRSPLYVVPLADIVEAELAAAGQNASERVTISGPAVELPGEGVQAVALAVHELATNAVKYGAIAQPSGRLSVMWRVEAGDSVGERRLVIDWHESGIAMPDAPPLRRGYGSELITRALPYQLNAETDLVFTPDGVRCRIILPADRFRVRSGQESKGAQV